MPCDLGPALLVSDGPSVLNTWLTVPIPTPVGVYATVRQVTLLTPHADLIPVGW